MIQFVSLLLFAFQAQAEIPDFNFQIFHGDPSHLNLWAIELTPPAGHHFNLEAPHGVQQGKIKFDSVQEAASKLVFQTDAAEFNLKSNLEVSAFVCDEKKTYCMKKKMQVTPETSKIKIISEKFLPIQSSDQNKKKNLVKEKESFIDNDPAQAFLIAKKTRQPILIDFYGIWCPPCNLYVETIFKTKKFTHYSKKYVLLKMDADDEKSWELKSKFKVGGYPTIIVAQLTSNDSLEEVGRVVGYYPPDEFFSRIESAYLHRSDLPEQRWKGRLEERLASALDQKNYAEVIQLASTGQDSKIMVYRWIAEIKKNPDFLKDSVQLIKVKETLEEFKNNLNSFSSETITHAVDLLSDEYWVKQKQYFEIANTLIDELSKRIDVKTMFVKGTELTAPDLDSMRMDMADSQNDEVKVSKYRKSAIENYEKLIIFYRKNGNLDLRSMNLEYSYLLWKDGKFELAKKIYDQFILKYPKEFTFYYAASKMYLSLKDLPKARELAENAFKFSYGDNRIRAMDRLLSIMSEQGFMKEASLRGNEFFKTIKVPQGFEVRTGRYIDALKATLAKIEKTTEAKK